MKKATLAKSAILALSLGLAHSAKPPVANAEIVCWTAKSTPACLMNCCCDTESSCMSGSANCSASGSC